MFCVFDRVRPCDPNPWPKVITALLLYCPFPGSFLKDGSHGFYLFIRSTS
jgi:hypothetical protein